MKRIWKRSISLLLTFALVLSFVPAYAFEFDLDMDLGGGEQQEEAMGEEVGSGGEDVGSGGEETGDDADSADDAGDMGDADAGDTDGDAGDTDGDTAADTGKADSTRPGKADLSGSAFDFDLDDDLEEGETPEVPGGEEIGGDLFLKTEDLDVKVQVFTDGTWTVTVTNKNSENTDKKLEFGAGYIIIAPDVKSENIEGTTGTISEMLTRELISEKGPTSYDNAKSLVESVTGLTATAKGSTGDYAIIKLDSEAITNSITFKSSEYGELVSADKIAEKYGEKYLADGTPVGSGGVTYGWAMYSAGSGVGFWSDKDVGADDFTPVLVSDPASVGNLDASTEGSEKFNLQVPAKSSDHVEIISIEFVSNDGKENAVTGVTPIAGKKLKDDDAPNCPEDATDSSIQVNFTPTSLPCTGYFLVKYKGINNTAERELEIPVALASDASFTITAKPIEKTYTAGTTLNEELATSITFNADKVGPNYSSGSAGTGLVFLKNNDYASLASDTDPTLEDVADYFNTTLKDEYNIVATVEKKGDFTGVGLGDDYQSVDKDKGKINIGGTKDVNVVTTFELETAGTPVTKTMTVVKLASKEGTTLATGKYSFTLRIPVATFSAKLSQAGGSRTPTGLGFLEIPITITVEGADSPAPEPPAPTTGSATFDPDGGTWSDNTTDPKTATGTIGDAITAPATVTKSGYKFEGWYTAKEGGGSQLSASDLYAADTTPTYYAKWTANVATVKVTLDGDPADMVNTWTGGGALTLVKEGADAITLTKSDTGVYTASAVPNGTYVVYAGSGDNANTGVTVMVKDTSPEVTVQFWTVTFDKNLSTASFSATNATQYVRNGLDATVANADPTDSTNTFQHWYLSTDTSEAKVTDFTNVTGTTTYKAKWDTTKYDITVTTKLDGSAANVNNYTALAIYAKGADTSTATAVATGTLSSGTVTVSGKLAPGEYDLYLGTNKMETFGVSNAAVSKVYDFWTVSFDKNGADSDNIDSQVVVNNGKPTAVTAPTKNGYQFAGWKNGTNAAITDVSTVAITGTTTYTAQWKKNTVTLKIYKDGTLTNISSDWLLSNHKVQYTNLAIVNGSTSVALTQAKDTSGADIAGTYVTTDAVPTGNWGPVMYGNSSNWDSFSVQNQKIEAGGGDLTFNVYFYTVTVQAQTTGTPATTLGYVATEFDAAEGNADASTSTTTSIEKVYLNGAGIKIDAKPITNYTFKEWTKSGDSTVGTPASGSAKTLVTVKGTTTITANFEKTAYSGTVTVKVNGDAFVGKTVDGATTGFDADGDITQKITVTAKDSDVANPTVVWNPTAKNWDMTGLKNGKTYTISVKTPTGTYTQEFTQPNNDTTNHEVNFYTVSVVNGAGNDSTNKPLFTDHNDSPTEAARIVIPAGKDVNLKSHHKNGYTLTGWVQNDASGSALPEGASAGVGKDADTAGTFALTTAYNGTSELEIKPIYTYAVEVDTWYDMDGNGTSGAGEYVASNVVLKTSSGTASGTISGSNGEYTFTGLTPGTEYEVWVNGFKAMEQNDEGAWVAITVSEENVTNARGVRLYKVSTAVAPNDSANSNVADGTAYVALGTTVGTDTFVYVPEGASSGSNETVSVKAAVAASNPKYRLAAEKVTGESKTWTTTASDVSFANANNASTTVSFSSIAADITATANFVRQYDVTTAHVDDAGNALASTRSEKTLISDKQSAGTTITTPSGAKTNSAMVDNGTYVVITATPASSTQVKGWSFENGKLYKTLEGTTLKDELDATAAAKAYNVTTVYFVPTGDAATVTAVYEAKRYDGTITVKLDNAATGTAADTSGSQLKVKLTTDGTNFYSDGTTAEFVVPAADSGTTVKKGVVTIPNLPAATYKIYTNMIDGTSYKDSHVTMTISATTKNNNAEVNYYTVSFETKISDKIAADNKDNAAFKTQTVVNYVSSIDSDDYPSAISVNPSKTNYTFLGWDKYAKNASGNYVKDTNTANQKLTGAAIANQQIAATTEYRAVWQKNTATVKVTKDGKSTAYSVAKDSKIELKDSSNNVVATKTLTVAGSEFTDITADTGKELKTGVAYKIFLDGKDTGETITLSATTGTGTGYAVFYTLTVKVDNSTDYGDIALGEGNSVAEPSSALTSTTGVYLPGTEVAINAKADTNYDFVKWTMASGGAIDSTSTAPSTAEAATFKTGNAATTFTASFKKIAYSKTVTVKVNGTEVNGATGGNVGTGNEIVSVTVSNKKTGDALKTATMTWNATKKYWDVSNILTDEGKYTVTVVTMTGTYDVGTFESESSANVVANFYTVEVVDGLGNTTKKPYIGTDSDVKKAVIPVSTTVTLVPNPDSGYTFAKAWKKVTTSGDVTITDKVIFTNDGTTFKFDSDYNSTGIVLKPQYTYEITLKTWYDKVPEGSSANGTYDSGEETAPGGTVEVKTGFKTGTVSDGETENDGVYTVTGLDPAETSYEIWVNGFKSTMTASTANIAADGADNSAKVQLFKVSTAISPAAAKTAGATAYVALGAFSGIATEVYVPAGAKSGTDQQTISVKATTATGYRLSDSAHGPDLWTSTTLTVPAANKDTASTTVTLPDAGASADMTVTATFVKSYALNTAREGVSDTTSTVRATTLSGETAYVNITHDSLVDKVTADMKFDTSNKATGTVLAITASIKTGDQVKGWKVSGGKLYSDATCENELTATDGIYGTATTTETSTTVYFVPDTDLATTAVVTAVYQPAVYNATITVKLDGVAQNGVSVKLYDGSKFGEAKTTAGSVGEGDAAVNAGQVVFSVGNGTYTVWTNIKDTSKTNNEDYASSYQTITIDNDHNSEEVNFYTVSYDLNGAETPSTDLDSVIVPTGKSTYVATGAYVNSKNDPTLTGYTFAGWDKNLWDADEGKFEDNDAEAKMTTTAISTDPVTAKVQYKAKWTENSVTVNLKINGETKNAASDMAFTLKASGKTDIPVTIESGKNTATVKTTTDAKIIAGTTYTIYYGGKEAGTVTVSTNGSGSGDACFYELEVKVKDGQSDYGTVSGNPAPGTLYVVGDTVDIDATPNTNYSFSKWNDTYGSTAKKTGEGATGYTYTIAAGGKNIAEAEFVLSGYTASIVVNLDDVAQKGAYTPETGDARPSDIGSDKLITEVKLAKVGGTTSDDISLTWDETAQAWTASGISTTGSAKYNVVVTAVVGNGTANYEMTTIDKDHTSATVNLYSVTVAAGEHGNKTKNPYIGATGSATAVAPIGTEIENVYPNPDSASYTIEAWQKKVGDNYVDLAESDKVAADATDPAKFSFSTGYTAATAGTGLTIYPRYTYTAYVNTYYEKDSAKTYTATTVRLIDADGNSFGAESGDYGSDGIYRVPSLTPGKTYDIWVNNFKAMTKDGETWKAITAGETNLTADDAKEVRLYKVITTTNPTKTGDTNFDGSAYVALGTTVDTDTEVYVPEGASTNNGSTITGQETVSVKATAGTNYRLAKSTTANGQTTAEKATWTGTNFGSDANTAANTVTFTNIAADITATANFVLQHTVTTAREDDKGNTLDNKRTETALIKAAQSDGTTITTATPTNSAKVDKDTYVKIEATAASATQLKTWKISEDSEGKLTGKLYRLDEENNLVEITENTLTSDGTTTNLGTWGDYTDTVVYFIPSSANAKVTAVFEAKRYDAEIKVYIDGALMKGVDNNAQSDTSTLSSYPTGSTTGDGNGTLRIKLATSSTGGPTYYVADDGTSVWSDDNNDGIITIPNLPVDTYDIYTNALSTFKNTHEDLKISSTGSNKQEVFYYTAFFDTTVGTDSEGNTINADNYDKKETVGTETLEIFRKQIVSGYVSNVSSNEHVAKPTEAPAKSGYTFKSWSKYKVVDGEPLTSAEATGIEHTTDGFKAQTMSYTTLYKAVWQSNNVTINVRLDDDDYEAIDGNATLTLLNSDGTETSTEITATLTDGDGVFYAVPDGKYTLNIPTKTDSWTIEVSGNPVTKNIDYYTVKFELQGGTAGSDVTTDAPKGDCADQIILSGGTVTKPSNPSYSGYTFKGWFTTSAGNTEFNYSTKITAKDTIIYAQWTQNQPGLKVTDFNTTGVEADAGVTSTRTTTDSSKDYQHQDRNVTYNFNAISGKTGASTDPYKVSIENTGATALTVQLQVFKFDKMASVPNFASGTWTGAETINTTDTYNWTTNADGTTTATVSFTNIANIALAATGAEGAKKDIAEITVESTARNKDDGVLVFRFTSKDPSGATGPTVYYVFNLAVDPLPITAATIEAANSTGTDITTAPAEGDIVRLTDANDSTKGGLNNITVTQGTDTSANAYDEKLTDFNSTDSTGDIKYRWVSVAAGATAPTKNDFKLDNGTLTIKNTAISAAAGTGNASKSYTVTANDLNKDLYLVVYSAGDSTNAKDFAISGKISTRYTGKIQVALDSTTLTGSDPGYTIKLKELDASGTPDGSFIDTDWDTTTNSYTAQLEPGKTYAVYAENYKGTTDTTPVDTGLTYSGTTVTVNYYTFSYAPDITVDSGVANGYTKYLPSSAADGTGTMKNGLTTPKISTNGTTYAEIAAAAISTDSTTGVKSVAVLKDQYVTIDINGTATDGAASGAKSWSGYQANHTLTTTNFAVTVDSASVSSGIQYAASHTGDAIQMNGTKSTLSAELKPVLYTVNFIVQESSGGNKASVKNAKLTVDATKETAAGTTVFAGAPATGAKHDTTIAFQVPQSEHYTISAEATDADTVLLGYKWLNSDTDKVKMNNSSEDWANESDNNQILIVFASSGLQWLDDHVTADTFKPSGGYDDANLVYGYTAPTHKVQVQNTGTTALSDFHITSTDNTTTPNFTATSMTTAKMFTVDSAGARTYLNADGTTTTNAGDASTFDLTAATGVTLPAGAYVEFNINVVAGKGASTTDYTAKFTATGTYNSESKTADYEPKYKVAKAPITFVNALGIDAPVVDETTTPDQTANNFAFVEGFTNSTLYPDPSLNTEADNTLVKWYEGSSTTAMASTALFKNGKTYTAEVTLTPDSNHEFKKTYIENTFGTNGGAFSEADDTGYFILNKDNTDSAVSITRNSDGTLTLRYTFPATAASLSDPIASSILTVDGKGKGRFNSLTIDTDSTNKQDVYYILATVTDEDNLTALTASEILNKASTTSGITFVSGKNGVAKGNDGNGLSGAVTFSDIKFADLADGTKYYVFAVAVPHGTDVSSGDKITAAAALASNVVSDSFTTPFSVTLVLDGTEETHGDSEIVAPNPNPTYVQAADDKVPAASANGDGGIDTGTANLEVNRDTEYVITAWTATVTGSSPVVSATGTLADVSATMNGDSSEENIKKTYAPKENTTIKVEFTGEPKLKITGNASGGKLLNWKYGAQPFTNSTATDAPSQIVMDPTVDDKFGKVTNTGTKSLEGNATLIVTPKYVWRDSKWQLYTDEMFAADLLKVERNEMTADELPTSTYFTIKTGVTNNTNTNDWVLNAGKYGQVQVLAGAWRKANDNSWNLETPYRDADNYKNVLDTNRLSAAWAETHTPSSKTDRSDAGGGYLKDYNVSFETDGNGNKVGIYQGILRAYDAGSYTLFDSYNFDKNSTDATISLEIRVVDDGWAGNPIDWTWDLNPRSHGNNTTGAADPDVAVTHKDWAMDINTGGYNSDSKLEAVAGKFGATEVNTAANKNSWNTATNTYTFMKDVTGTKYDYALTRKTTTGGAVVTDEDAYDFAFHVETLKKLAYTGFYKNVGTMTDYYVPDSGDWADFKLTLEDNSSGRDNAKTITLNFIDTRPGLTVKKLNRSGTAVTAVIDTVQHDGGPTAKPTYTLKNNLTAYGDGGTDYTGAKGWLKNNVYDAHVRWYSVTPAQHAEIEALLTDQAKFDYLKTLNATTQLVQQCGDSGISGTGVLTYNYQTTDIGNYLYCTVEGDNVWFRDVAVSAAQYIAPTLTVKALRNGDHVSGATDHRIEVISKKVAGEDLIATGTTAKLGTTTAGVDIANKTLTFTQPGEVFTLKTNRQDTAKKYFFTKWSDVLTNVPSGSVSNIASANGTYAAAATDLTATLTSVTSADTTLIAYYDLLPTLGSQAAKYDLGSDVEANRTLSYTQHDGSGDVTVTIKPVGNHTFAGGSTDAKTLTVGNGLEEFNMNANTDAVSNLVLDETWIAENLILSGLSDGKYIITVKDNVKSTTANGNIYDVSTEFVVTRAAAHITLKAQGLSEGGLDGVHHGKVELTDANDITPAGKQTQTAGDANITGGKIDPVTLHAYPDLGYAFEDWYIEDWKDGKLVYYKAGTPDANKYGTFDAAATSPTDGSATVSFEAKVTDVTVEARFKKIEPTAGSGTAQKGSDTISPNKDVAYVDGRTDTTKKYEIGDDDDGPFTLPGWLEIDQSTGHISIKDGFNVPDDAEDLNIPIKITISKDGESSVIEHTTYTLTITDKAPTGGGGGGGGGVEECPVKVYYWLGLDGTTSDVTIESVYEGDSPKNIPSVTALDGLTFLGWSLTKPTEGKTVALIDPASVKITEDTTFYAVYAERPYHEHYVIGYPNGNFGPADNINRASVATIIARAILPGFVEGSNYGNPGGYSDVSGHWAESAIAYCSKYGVFEGYLDGTFRPNQSITRQEFALVIARLAGLQKAGKMPFSDIDEAGDWALDGIYTAYHNGWVNGYTDGTFRPLAYIRRDEAVKVFNGYLNRGVDKDGLSDLTEYVHSGVASNNTEDGTDEYMTWPDVPKTQWAYYEIIEAANDHEYEIKADGSYTVPEHWTKCWIDEKWRYHDDLNDGGQSDDTAVSAPNTNIVGNH